MGCLIASSPTTQQLHLWRIQEFAKELGIQITYALVAYPQTNGQVEKVNGLICSGLKKRLRRPLKCASGAWVKELPSVLWSLHTTPNASIGYTPFFRLFGEEVVLPSNVHYNAPCVMVYVEENSAKALKDAQDMLDET
jgi:hypothetical protein